MRIRERIQGRIEALRARHRSEPDVNKKRSLWVWIQILVLVAQIIKLWYVGKKQ